MSNAAKRYMYNYCNWHSQLGRSLTIMSPSSGTSLSLCLTIPLCATVPSDLKTQLSELFPKGILFKSHFFVASPTPHAPVK